MRRIAMRSKQIKRVLGLLFLSMAMALSFPLEGKAFALIHNSREETALTTTSYLEEGSINVIRNQPSFFMQKDLQNIENLEAPKKQKQFFIGLEDLHSRDSYLDQEALAQQSESWQSFKQENLLRNHSYRLAENGRMAANVARYTPEGLHYTHDVIVRWQIDEEDVFCIQEGVFTAEGIQYDAKIDLDSLISEALSERLSMIGYFGYYQHRTMQNYALTQMMIWDELGGNFINYGIFGQTAYDSFKTEVNRKIHEYELKPSWHDTTVVINVGEEVRIADATNRFSTWDGSTIKNTAGVTIQKDGNDLIIRATASANDTGILQFAKHDPNDTGIGTSFAYTHGHAQDIARLHLTSPGVAHLNIEVVKDGHAQIKKIDETTGLPLSGATFRLTTDDEQIREITTTDDGIVEWRDLSSDTKVTIEEIQASSGYVINSMPQTIIIRPDETSVVTFGNRPQVGQLELHKTVETGVSLTESESEFGFYTTIGFEQRNGKDFEFKIRPTEDITTSDGTLRYPSGEFLQVDGEDIIWKTDENGILITEPILYLGKYEIIEIGAPKGVVLLEEPVPFEIEEADQTVSITSATLEIENFLQKINIYGRKKQETVVDWQEGQAVIELEMARNNQVFALRLKEALSIGEDKLAVDTTLGYSMVEEGVIRFENLQLPNQKVPMYIQEIEAGSDHVLDDTKHAVVYEPKTNEPSVAVHVDANQPDELPEIELAIDNSAKKIVESNFSENQKAVKELVIAREEELPEFDHDKETEKEEDTDDSEAIINYLARGNVKVIKTDAMDEKPLKGVEFELIHLSEVLEIDSEEVSDESEDIENKEDENQKKYDSEKRDVSEMENSQEKRTVIGTYLTNADGEILVEDLPTGNYLWLETQPLNWYHTRAEEYHFSVSPENSGETIVVEITNDRLSLEIETLFAEAETGSKVVDPTIDVSLIDYAWVRGGKKEHEYHVVTQYINVETKEVIDEDKTTFISLGDEEQELLFSLTIPAETMKDGDELVATHMVYSDEKKNHLVKDHYDLSNKEQTVNFEAMDEREKNGKIPSNPDINQTPAIPQAGSYSAWEEAKAATVDFFISIVKGIK